MTENTRLLHLIDISLCWKLDKHRSAQQTYQTVNLRDVARLLAKDLNFKLLATENKLVFPQFWIYVSSKTGGINAHQPDCWGHKSSESSVNLSIDVYTTTPRYLSVSGSCPKPAITKNKKCKKKKIIKKNGGLRCLCQIGSYAHPSHTDCTKC